MSGAELKDKIAIVTGSGNGIGRGIALAYAEAGAHVVVASRNQQNLDAVAAEIEALGRESLAIRTDVCDEVMVANLVSTTVAKFGRLDIMVNNAAILGPGSTEAFACTEEEWDRVMAVDLKSHYLCAMAAGKGMMERKSGNIIHIDSIEANMQLNGAARPYAVAKAAVTVTSSDGCSTGCTMACGRVWNMTTDTTMAARIKAIGRAIFRTLGLTKFPSGEVGKAACHYNKGPV